MKRLLISLFLFNFLFSIPKDAQQRLFAAEPDAPGTPLCSEIGTSSMTVSWTAPADDGGSAITAYILQYSTDRALWGTAYTGAATTTNINTLSGGTTYYFRVAAKNASSAYGAYSSEGSATTLTPVPSAPTGLNLTDKTATTANLTWTAPAGSILRYAVEWGESGEAFSLSDTTNATTMQITGLDKATAYTVRVLAENAGGWSTASSPLSFTTLASVPDAPPQATLTVTGTDEIDVSWEAPANDGGSTILFYVLHYEVQGSGSPSSVMEASRAFTLSGLQTHTTYSVTIQAYNTMGFSAASVAAEATTFAVAPSISTLTASDPDDGDTVFGTEDRLTITFDMDTNTPPVSSKAELDALLSFSSSLGTAYSGVWSDASTLAITISNATGGNPQVGLFTATVKAAGGLKNAAESSAVCTATSPVLTGNWGGGSAPPWTTVPASATMDEDATLSLAGISFANPDEQIQVILTASAGVIHRPGYASESPMTLSGTSSALTTALDGMTYAPSANFNGAAVITIEVREHDAPHSPLNTDAWPVTVTAVNDAPVNTLPAAVTAAEGNFTFHAGTATEISISDADLPAESTEAIQVYVKATSGGRVLPATVAGLNYLPDIDNGLRTYYRISGTVANINRALDGLIYKCTDNTLTTDQIQVRTSDLGNTGEGGVLEDNDDIDITLDWTPVPPVLQSAQITDDMTQVILTFDQPLNAGTVSVDKFGPAGNFELAQAGSPAAAYATLTLCFGATILPGDSLAVENGAVTSVTDGIGVAGKCELQAPETPIIPMISLSCSPKFAFTENTATITANVHNLGGRAGTYTWQGSGTLHALISPCTGPVATFAINQIAPDFYTAKLTVTNWVGGTSEMAVIEFMRETDNSLPVTLSRFTACQEGRHVTLQWQTESEQDNLGFIIERAHGTSKWQEIASYRTAEALKGAGNSCNRIEYSFTDEAPPSADFCTYRLYDVNCDGTAHLYDSFTLALEAMPEATLLQPAVPNPFNPQTTIGYTLAEDSPVCIVVYDLLGRRVKQLLDAVQPAGRYQVFWHGEDEAGNQVASGTYIIRMTTAETVKVIKVMLLR